MDHAAQPGLDLRHDVRGLLAHVGGLFADRIDTARCRILGGADALRDGLLRRGGATLGGLCRPLDALGHLPSVLRIGLSGQPQPPGQKVPPRRRGTKTGRRLSPTLRHRRAAGTACNG